MDSNVRIAVLGGDRRELYLAKYLVAQGYDVRLSGYEKLSDGPAINYLDSLQAVVGVQAVIMPLAGVKENLSPNCPFSDYPPKFDRQFFSALPVGTPVFIGWARDAMKELASSVQLIEVAGDEELAILNSIPTAEGAVAIAMNQTAITLHGSETLVLGFGRCAISLARMLSGIGASVTIAARKAADLARAYEMGFNSCYIDELVDQVGNKQFIFNTVPAMILSGEILEKAVSCQIIVDIASGKGGTDFGAAEKYGIDAVLAPGLPGKVAPVTAGKILTRVYPRFFKQYGVNRR